MSEPLPVVFVAGLAKGGAKPLTKTAQIRCVGNSVCPPVAAALVRANCADLAAGGAAAPLAAAAGVAAAGVAAE